MAEGKKKPSGVKAQSASEAAQSRGLAARVAKLEKVVDMLARGHVSAAYEEVHK